MRRLLLCAALSAATMGLSAQKAMKAPAGGKAISDELIGIFFEDISSSADGGLYAELLQNGSFEYNANEKDGWGPATAWKVVRPGHSLGFIQPIVSTVPSNIGGTVVAPVTQTQMWLHVERSREFHDFKGWKGYGLQNDGFDGMPVKAGASYDFSMRISNIGAAKQVRVALVEPQGWGRDPKLLADATFDIAAHENAQVKDGKLVAKENWREYKATLTPNADCSKAALQILVLNDGDLYLDDVSLMPQDTYKGHGLRKDLAQALADLQPKFMRFPGGCVVHGGGDGFWNTYRWKNTIGPRHQRIQQKNTWGYHQSMGLGYYEYFQFCEDLGMEPVPILPCGVSCQGTNGGWNMWPTQAQDVVRMDEMDEWVQDALDLIEWANGDPATSKWAKMRAEQGHPKPFNLKYLGIGNEDLISPTFEERYLMICRAVKAKYPDITVCGTVGPFYYGSDYEEGWRIANRNADIIDMVDEHYYLPPSWYIYNQDFYDNYDRRGPKVYLGEWAAHVPGRRSTIETALCEALHYCSLERNGDVVEMSSYAPLLAKDGHTQWNPDMIYFNNTEVKPTVGYYSQMMCGQSAGNEYLPSTIQADNRQTGVGERLAVSTVRDTRTGRTYLKLVNVLNHDVEAHLTLKGLLAGEKTCKRTLLTGAYDSTTARPKTDEVRLSPDCKYVMPAYSFTLIAIE